MATFTYTAVNKQGTHEDGTIEAVNTLAAGHLLKEQGLMPLELKEKHQNRLWQIYQSMTKVPLKEKIVFIENLNLMLRSGIAAPRGLRILARQTKNKKFQNIMVEIAAGVESGKSLHEALALYPDVFSNIFVSMVKIGELSGNLEKSLEYLGVQLEREADLKSKTKGAMIYPSVIISVMLIIGLLMAIFVLPKLTATFKEFNAELPFLTRIVITVTDFMAGHAVLVLGGVVVLVAGVIAFLRTQTGKRALHFFLIHAPAISPIVKKINLARTARILSSMMKSGIAIVEGLGVTAEALDNSYYKTALAQAASNVKVGKPLTEALAKNENLFPFIVTEMLEVGEETGSMENILEQLAQNYEAEIDNTMRNLSSIIEPVLLIVIGVVVGFLAIALISPIYNISQGIQ